MESATAWQARRLSRTGKVVSLRWIGTSRPRRLHWGHWQYQYSDGRDLRVVVRRRRQFHDGWLRLHFRWCGSRSSRFQRFLHANDRLDGSGFGPVWSTSRYSLCQLLRRRRQRLDGPRRWRLTPHGSLRQHRLGRRPRRLAGIPNGEPQRRDGHDADERRKQSGRGLRWLDDDHRQRRKREQCELRKRAGSCGYADVAGSVSSLDLDPYRGNVGNSDYWCANVFVTNIEAGTIHADEYFVCYTGMSLPSPAPTGTICYSRHAGGHFYGMVEGEWKQLDNA